MFIKQLKALQTTMSNTGPETFDMEQWHCGTIACVCGHQVVSGDLTYFTTARLEKLDTGDILHTCSLLANDLDISCGVKLGTDHLSRSIWQSNARLILARCSGLLTEEQLNHPHLTTDSSPADVVSYIDMLLGVIDV